MAVLVVLIIISRQFLFYQKLIITSTSSIRVSQAIAAAAAFATPLLCWSLGTSALIALPYHSSICCCWSVAFHTCCSVLPQLLLLSSPASSCCRHWIYWMVLLVLLHCLGDWGLATVGCSTGSAISLCCHGLKAVRLLQVLCMLLLLLL
jgi:hypothetical protein